MTRTGIKIGLMCVGVCSTILLLITLPTLIWSPSGTPYKYYSKHGGNDEYYYTLTDSRLIEHSYTTLSTNGFMKINQINRLAPVNDNEWYELSSFNMHQSRTYRYNNGTLTCHSVMAGDSGVSPEKLYATYHAINNPFTLWYIKWLEWTQ